MKQSFPIDIKEVIAIGGFSLSLLGILLSLGLSGVWAALISFSCLIALVMIQLQVRILNSNQKKYETITGQEGDELIESIKAAEKSIVTTAFSSDKPTDKYLKSLLGKLDEGVAITRILPSNCNTDHDSSWTNQFKEKPHYKEKITNGDGFPFDIYIFDNKLTKLYFPASHEHDQFKDGVVFSCPDMASKFKTALDRAVS